MSVVWNRRLSPRIRELGYDISLKTLIVGFPGGERHYYTPVTYEMYAAISSSRFPERVFRQTIERKVPRVPETDYP